MPDFQGSQAIHIALTFDDKFWAPAYATMRSICLTTHRRSDLVFHLIHLSLTPDHKADLDAIGDEFGAALRYYDLESLPEYEATVSQLRFRARLSYLTYARFFLDRILGDDVDRVIYIDCDFLVLAPIEELYESDLDGQPLGAVKSERSLLLTNHRDIKARRELFDPADPYFNAGILLVDMAGWRAADVLGTVNAVIEEGRYTDTFTGQPYLNLAFKGRWSPIDWRWNVYAKPSAGIEALHPKGLHYVGPHKPWYLTSGVTHKQTYRHVMTNALFHKYMRYRWKRNWMRFGR